ncbi:MAG: MATE family efflux transporter [Tidjanibacter sp.]|nr:MATE family efflux transporter [Tidjanibacter sp.]
MSENLTKAQELGVLDIKKLLFQYALPAIIAMTASSLYNMVDSIFIGQGVGALAISGLAVTFPLINLTTAFGTLVGVGAASLTSILLGQKNYRMASRVLGNVMTMNVTLGVGIGVIALLFLDPILCFFGASEQTIGYARDYMIVILLGNVFTHLYFGLNAMLRAAGHPRRAMRATILTVCLNAVLDPIFIFVLDWGIQGAAIATVLAQVVSLVWQLRIFSDRSELLHFDKGVFCMDVDIAKRSLSIGLAPFLMNTASCFVVLFINQQLKHFGGDLAIGAYGIVNRVVFLFVMIVMGFTQGMQPIAGYNYGARMYDRVMKVLKYTIICGTAVMTAGFLLSQLCPRIIVSAFTKDVELIRLATEGFKITMLVAPVVGAQIVISNFFQSIGLVGRSIFMSLSRQLLFLLPCLAILPLFFGQNGVWYSLPVSDFIAAIVAFVLLMQVIRKFRREMAAQKQEKETTNNLQTR